MHIERGNWDPRVRAKLRALLSSRGIEGRDAVFDVDNTVLCRNLGDPVSELLCQRGLCERFAIPTGLSRAHVPHDSASPIPLDMMHDAHYERHLEQARLSADPDTAYADAYCWAVWIMRGLSPLDIVRVSEEAYDNGSAAEAAARGDGIQVVPGTRFPRPFCRPEILDLFADLTDAGVRIWLISSSTVWTLRWLVQRIINPALAARGARGSLEPEHILGMSSLVSDEHGRVHADQNLVRASRSYAEQAPEELLRYRLTGELSYPVSCFHGKGELIKKHLPRAPILAAGDSVNDLDMFHLAQHSLWLAGIERTDNRIWSHVLAEPVDSPRWLVQPVQNSSRPGLVADITSVTFPIAEAQQYVARL